MLDLDDPDHARLRSLVGKAFTPRLIERLRGRVEALSEELLDAMERKGARRGEAELVADYALPLPATVIAELLGVPRKTMPSSTGGRIGWSPSPRAATWCGPSPPRFRSCATSASSSSGGASTPRTTSSRR
jgi:cytochrome P450